MATHDSLVDAKFGLKCLSLFGAANENSDVELATLGVRQELRENSTTDIASDDTSANFNSKRIAEGPVPVAPVRKILVHMIFLAEYRRQILVKYKCPGRSPSLPCHRHSRRYIYCGQLSLNRARIRQLPASFPS